MSDYYSPPEVNAVSGLIDTFLRWKNENEPPRGFERYHPSAFGKCLRQMQYDRYAERGYIDRPVEEFEPFLLRIFGNGHSMHDRWRDYFDELGILRGYWQCQNAMCAAFRDDGTFDDSAPAVFQETPGEIARHRRWYGKDDIQGVFRPDRCICGSTKFHYHEIDVVSDELNFYGHCDAIIDFSRFDGSKYMNVKQSYLVDYLPTKPVVVDFKTINMFDFKDIKENGTPHDYYVTQLTIYANVLDCDFGILLYENKNNQNTLSFRVDRNSDTLFELVRMQAQQMNDMVEVEDNGELFHLLPPPKPLQQEDKECGYCKYREMCFASGVWEDPELAEKRREFYTIGGQHERIAKLRTELTVIQPTEAVSQS